MGVDMGGENWQRKKKTMQMFAWIQCEFTFADPFIFHRTAFEQQQ